MRVELEEFKKKYGQLKRNYDSMSLHAKKDSELNKKILEMKEEYEKQISELKAAKQEAEGECAIATQKLQTSEGKLKEATMKVSNQTKEIETLKNELARK